MKKIAIIATLILSMAVVFIGCKDKRSTGSVYMPDMAYSRGYETYATRDSVIFTANPNDAGHKIFYNNLPPAGTIKRGELFPYALTQDSANYIISANVINPVADLTGAELEEAGRLYNINCAVCHGATGVANGPLSAKIGAIANLTQPKYVTMADGTMFYSITYGLNNMGSYASQLTREQRWKVIKYIRTLQPKADAGATAVKTDSVVTKK
jgi:mono/diheme cytochrome c family protein